MKIKPRKLQILVKPQEEESRVSKKSGLVTPDSVEQEIKAIGEVVAIGGGIDDIKVGDKVIYGVYAGEVINFEEVEYKLLHDEDVLASLV